MRAIALIGTVTSLLLVTACGSTVQRQDGDAAPAGSPAETSAAPAITAPTSSPPSSTATTASTASLVLGPAALGTLKLGMTKQQATASGTLLAFDKETPVLGGCAVAVLRDDPKHTQTAFLSPTLGIAAINAYGNVKTPEGVHIGTSSADVLRIYPGTQFADGDATNSRGYAAVPGNDKAVYRIATANGAVTELTLQYKNQDCYE